MPTNLRDDKPKVRSQSLVLGLFVLVLGLYVLWKSSQQPVAKPVPAPAEQEQKEAENTEESPLSKSVAIKAAAAPSAHQTLQTQVPGVTVRDQDEQVVFHGTVDVGPTLKRIARGEKLRFSHDGIVFENREQRLPKKPTGYYREYVHPTAKMSGPGPQRIVKGKGGEIFYSFDHYETFLRLDQP